MNYNPAIHSSRHLVKNILGNAESILTEIPHPNDELLVLNYHGTPLKFMDNFKRQLSYFHEKYHFIKPSELPAYFDKKLTSGKPMMLLTFDDGIRNNLLAAEVLDQQKISALFFIVPEFVDAAQELQKDFFIKNIRPSINKEIDSAEEDLTSFSWEEINMLKQHGHEIGSHTMSHTLLSSSAPNEKSTYEISGAAKYISEKTGQPVISFCSPNDTLSSIGIPEMQLIIKNHQYHFTTYPGTNRTRAPFFIKRVNVESHWMLGVVKRATGIWDRKRWENKRACFESVLQKAGRAED
ncbi:MAG: polysaccharide deacetylase family protein [Bacteroidota bacterium]|nr:polysaccharide deacetylase family protein [Bacteroidota bacterium]